MISAFTGLRHFRNWSSRGFSGAKPFYISNRRKCSGCQCGSRFRSGRCSEYSRRLKRLWVSRGSSGRPNTDALDHSYPFPGLGRGVCGGVVGALGRTVVPTLGIALFSSFSPRSFMQTPQCKSSVQLYRHTSRQARRQSRRRSVHIGVTAPRVMVPRYWEGTLYSFRLHSVPVIGRMILPHRAAYPSSQAEGPRNALRNSPCPDRSNLVALSDRD